MALPATLLEVLLLLFLVMRVVVTVADVEVAAGTCEVKLLFCTLAREANVCAIVDQPVSEIGGRFDPCISDDNA